MDLRALAMGVGFAFVWSSAFTSARVVVAAAPPLSSLALRFLLAGLIAVAVAWCLGQSWRLTRSQWRATIVFGLCQNAIYLGLNFIAMQTVQASLAAIIASSVPLLVAFALWTTGAERLPKRAMAGLVAGIAGVALIMGTRVSSGADAGAVALCVIAVIALAAATLSVRGAASGGNVLMVVGLQMLIGSAAVAVPATLLGQWHPVEVTPVLTVAFLYTTLIPGLGATVLWFALVGRVGATRAATFHFLNPVFGVAIAAIILNEAVRLTDTIGVAIVTAGILAVQTARNPAHSASAGR